MSDIVIVVPVLGRPHNVRRLMESVASATSVPHRLLFVASPGDDAEISELEAAGADFVMLERPPGRGDYARKVNHAYRCTTERYIFTGADDLAFHPGWDKAALPKMSEGVGVVGTNDLGNQRVLRGEHSTHSLVCRDYADAFGTVDGEGILHEGYPHEFVDDELIGTAKARGAFAFAGDSVVEHLHPFWGKAEIDHLYADEPRRMVEGRHLFQKRRRLWEKGVLSAPVSVVVATYGDESWKAIAKRATESVERQTIPVAQIVSVHGETLAEARNEGARQATAPWLCFLDADDELHPQFMRAMSRLTSREGCVLNPAVQWVFPDGSVKPPKSFEPKDLALGNYLVIGTLVRKDVFSAAGGFDSQWEAWEDWAFWRRAVALGSKVRRVRSAVYRAHWRNDSRNNTVGDKEGLHRRIREDFDAWSANREKVLV